MNESLLRALPFGRDCCLDRGEALFSIGDLSLGLVLVRAGALELARTSPEGRPLVLQTAGPGETIAEASLFETRHHCEAVGTTPSRERAGRPRRDDGGRVGLPVVAGP